MGRRGFRVRMNQWWALGVFAALVAAAYVVVLWPASGPTPAPQAKALPLHAQVRLLRARAGGDLIDTAYDPHQYQYIAVAGPAGWSATKLMIEEVRYLISRGWQNMVAYSGTSNDPSSLVVRTPPKVSLGTPQASVLINGPHRIYAAFEPVGTISQDEQWGSGNPVLDAVPVLNSLKNHHAVLFVTLGNGRHG